MVSLWAIKNLQDLLCERNLFQALAAGVGIAAGANTIVDLPVGLALLPGVSEIPVAIDIDRLELGREATGELLTTENCP
jgi:hypothetical protein